MYCCREITFRRPSGTKWNIEPSVIRFRRYWPHNAKASIAQEAVKLTFFQQIREQSIEGVGDIVHQAGPGLRLDREAERFTHGHPVPALCANHRQGQLSFAFDSFDLYDLHRVPERR